MSQSEEREKAQVYQESEMYGCIKGVAEFIGSLVGSAILIIIVFSVIAEINPDSTFSVYADCIIIRIGEGDVINIDTCTQYEESSTDR